MSSLRSPVRDSNRQPVVFLRSRFWSLEEQLKVTRRFAVLVLKLAPHPLSDTATTTPMTGDLPLLPE